MKIYARLYFTRLCSTSLHFAGFTLSLPGRKGTQLFQTNKIILDKSYAFSGCSAIPSITIPQGVTTIGNNVFNNCSSLAKVVIEDCENTLTLGINDDYGPLFSSCPLDYVYIGRDISYQTESYYGYSPFYRNTTLREVEELTRKDREKWQLSEVDKAMVRGAEKACEMIEDKAEGHLIRLTSRMEWFPVVYHLVDKVALVVFTVLGYYTGKHHLNDDLVFLWLLAAMPVLIVSVIWGINELMA